MSFRSDVTVDWEASPRIITVASPSTEITIQDLHDTLTTLEMGLPEGTPEERIISSAGKESLGGGTFVGITTTLLNALLEFEARPGPSYTQCNVSGGNLVAVDAFDVPFTTPINPTAFTQVVVTASSSATLQEQTDIQYSSFGGGVSFDVLSSYTGTAYPVGTPRQPVNNMADALAIAAQRGFTTIFISGNYDFVGSDDYSGLIFVGEGKERTNVTIASSITINDATFRDMTITSGTLDGDSTISNCEIVDLDYINGIIEECILSEGTITLGGGASATFLDCWSGVPGGNTPIIDMGGSGQSLALRNYNGGVKITNKSGADQVSIDMASGQIKLAADVTNGTIICRGVGSITENLSVGATVFDQMLNPKTIWDEPISNHTTAGTVGKILKSARDWNLI